MIPGHRYLLPEVVGPRLRQQGLELIKKVAGYLPPDVDVLIVSDGLDVYYTGLKEVFAEEIYTYFINRQGEKVPQKVKLPKRLNFARIREETDEYGKLKGIYTEIIFGDKDTVERLLAGDNIDINQLERCNLTRRLQVSKLHRKSLCFAKCIIDFIAHLTFQRVTYNFCWRHSSLKRPTDRIARNGRHITDKITPAMSIGLTDHPWKLEDLLNYALPIQ